MTRSTPSNGPTGRLASLVFGAAFGAAALLGASPASAAFNDGCILYEHTNFGGDAYKIGLPDSDTVKVGSEPWGPNSERRNGALLGVQQLTGSVDNPGGVWRDHFSSARVFAGATDVTLYMYTGDDFDDQVVAFTCLQGQECSLAHLQAFNDRVHSVNCQREFPDDPNNPNPMVVLELPTNIIADTADSSLEDSLVAGVNDGDLDSYSIDQTSVTWTTSDSKCRARDWASEGMACSTHWTEQYKDELRLHQEFVMNPALGWLWDFIPVDCGDYDVETDIWVRPVDFNKKFEFRTTNHNWIWVEGGACTGKLIESIGEGIADQFVMVDYYGLEATPANVNDPAHAGTFTWRSIEQKLTYAYHLELGLRAGGQGMYDADFQGCLADPAKLAAANGTYGWTGCGVAGGCCQVSAWVNTRDLILGLGQSAVNFRERQQLTHTYNHDEQFVPESGFADVAGETPRVTNVWVDAYAPVIRLNRSRDWPLQIVEAYEILPMSGSQEIARVSQDLEGTALDLFELHPDASWTLDDEGPDDTFPPDDLTTAELADLPPTGEYELAPEIGWLIEDLTFLGHELTHLHVPYVEEVMASYGEASEELLDELYGPQDRECFLEEIEPAFRLEAVETDLEILER